MQFILETKSTHVERSLDSLCQVSELWSRVLPEMLIGPKITIELEIKDIDHIRLFLNMANSHLAGPTVGILTSARLWDY